MSAIRSKKRRSNQWPQGTAMSSTIASCKVIKPKVFHRKALCQTFSSGDCCPTFKSMFEKERTVISWFRKISIFSHDKRLPMWNKQTYSDQSLCIYRGTWPRLVGKRQSDLHNGDSKRTDLCPIEACHLSMCWCLGMGNPLSLWPWWQITFHHSSATKGTVCHYVCRRSLSCFLLGSTKIPRKSQQIKPVSSSIARCLNRGVLSYSQQREQTYATAPGPSRPEWKNWATWENAFWISGSQGDTCWEKSEAVLKRCSDLKSL